MARDTFLAKLSRFFPTGWNLSFQSIWETLLQFKEGFFTLWAQKDLNLRPADYESAALTN